MAGAPGHHRPQGQPLPLRVGPGSRTGPAPLTALRDSGPAEPNGSRRPQRREITRASRSSKVSAAAGPRNPDAPRGPRLDPVTDRPPVKPLLPACTLAGGGRGPADGLTRASYRAGRCAILHQLRPHSRFRAARDDPGVLLREYTRSAPARTVQRRNKMEKRPRAWQSLTR
ncbi:hypothetical protein NDU88_000945 [Pleurodeles waltl]|uniref:Uncharacterized protein n=1 Tax=Pleurodeles waltl TaxID=8319 RepID=A0AAV7KQ73_PLEWA|nr:hypothetical protein NDU88_000945 [Pleurodeles waltl]